MKNECTNKSGMIYNKGEFNKVMNHLSIPLVNSRTWREYHHKNVNMLLQARIITKNNTMLARDLMRENGP